MKEVPPQDQIVKGAQRTVAFARDAAGNAPAHEFLHSAEVPAKDRKRILHTWVVLADHGRVSDSSAFKKEAGNIWALNSCQVRVGVIQVGTTGFLTSGFIKKKTSGPPPNWRAPNGAARNT